MLIYFRCNTAIEGKLASNVKWTMQVASEKGASSWLATLPIAKHGFALHKGAFQDALCLQYGWRPPIYHLTVSVANTSQLSMHQSAPMVDSLRFATMS